MLSRVFLFMHFHALPATAVGRCRLPAMAVFFVVAVFPAILAGQIRTTQRSSIPLRMGLGPRVPAVASASRRFGVSPRPFGRRTLFITQVPFRQGLRFHIFFGSPCFTDPFFDPFFCRQFFSRNQFLFAKPLFLPCPLYTAAPYSQVAEQTPTAVTGPDSNLVQEVHHLTNKVQLLLEEEALGEQRRQTALQPRPSVESKKPTTILVFRDGHRSEVRNYAIVGQTLWVFSERRARRIPVSDLDVEATRKVNADRDVEFRLL